MSKKMMLIAFTMVSAVVFALPAVASAAENHLTNVTSFSGTVASGTLAAQNEYTITCGDATNINHVNGTVSAGGTTGNLEMDFTGCHTEVFGFTANCKTEGAPLANTIKTSGAFHLITTTLGKSAILMTPVKTNIICAGVTSTTVAGKVIGTVLNPACGVSSNSMTIRFTASGSTQEHKSYTGGTYNLIRQTGHFEAEKEAGLSTEATVSSPTTGTLDCT
jgi:hypothetical protein